MLMMGKGLSDVKYQKDYDTRRSVPSKRLFWATHFIPWIATFAGMTARIGTTKDLARFAPRKNKKTKLECL
jgi:hypothetical protein